MNKKIIAFILVASNVHSSPILVFGEGANQADFVRFMERRQGLTFIDEEAKRLRKSASEFRIREKFIDAKADLLKGRIEAAKANFFDIVSKSHKADWNEIDHALITHAFLNLAETSKSVPEKKFWITKAITFSLGQIPEFESLSRTTQEMVTEIGKGIGTSFYLPHTLFQEWEKILINGKEVTAVSLDKVMVVPDSYRVTLLSNSKLTQTLTLHSSQLESLSPEKSLIVSGSCENPHLNDQLDKKTKFLVFFSQNCERSWDNGWDVSKNLKLLPAYDLKSRADLPKEKDSIFKSKWFWGGVVLAGAIFLINQSSDSSSPNSAPPRIVSDEED